MSKLRYAAEVLVFGIFLGIVLGAFFTCQESKAGTFYRYNDHGTQSFTDDQRRIPKAAEGVERFTPKELRRTPVERPTPYINRQPVVGELVPAESETGHHVPADTTEGGPFTCVRERRQVGALNLPVYVTRNSAGQELNETPSVWGCPQTSINR